MPEDVYIKFRSALELSNEKNAEIFKGFSQKLTKIDTELKRVLSILEGIPNVPTQPGLASTVFNNSQEIEKLKSENTGERLTIIENNFNTHVKGYNKLLYKLIGGGIVILFLLGVLKEYLFKIFL